MAAKKKNGRKITAKTSGLAALYTLALIAAAVGLIVLSSVLLPGLGHAVRPSPQGPPPELSASDLALLESNFMLPIALSVVNVALAIYLLFIYVKDYLSLRSSFTLGIVAFLFSFLLYALSSSPLIYMALGPLGIASKLSSVPMLFSAIGLLIFAKLGNE